MEFPRRRCDDFAYRRHIVMTAAKRPLPTTVGLIVALGWPLVLAALVPNQNLANRGQDLLILLCVWVSVGVLFVIIVG